MKITKGWLKIACIINHSTKPVNADKRKDGYVSAINDMLKEHNLPEVDPQHVSRLLSEAVNGKTKETGFKAYLKRNGDFFEPI